MILTKTAYERKDTRTKIYIKICLETVAASLHTDTA